MGQILPPYYIGTPKFSDLSDGTAQYLIFFFSKAGFWQKADFNLYLSLSVVIENWNFVYLFRLSTKDGNYGETTTYRSFDTYVSCMRIMRHYAERVRIAHGHMDASTQLCKYACKGTFFL